jgi:hypothetical protein
MPHVRMVTLGGSTLGSLLADHFGRFGVDGVALRCGQLPMKPTGASAEFGHDRRLPGHPAAAVRLQFNEPSVACRDSHPQPKICCPSTGYEPSAREGRLIVETDRSRLNDVRLLCADRGARRVRVHRGVVARERRARGRDRAITNTIAPQLDSDRGKSGRLLHPPSLSTYIAPQGLRQDPGDRAESPAEASTCGNHRSATFACLGGAVVSRCEHVAWKSWVGAGSRGRAE